VALKCLVDNVATHAVEMILIQKLESFLSPSRVIEMHPELVENIAAESPSAVHQREQLSRKLEVLVAGIETCRRYASRGARSKSTLHLDDFHEPLQQLDKGMLTTSRSSTSPWLSGS
jgi:hypothetical protein